MADFKALAGLYKDELLGRTIPFWLEHSQDLLYGGYFTCLDREGKVYDTDKFMWLQGRQVWMFAKLYNTVEQRKEWLDCAVQGAEFMLRNGHNGKFNWYFALDRYGHPLVEPYNIFSYTFAAIALGQLAIATGEKRYRKAAKRTFEAVMEKVDNPKGRWSKVSPGARKIKTFDLPMILCNVALELEQLLPKDVLDGTIDRCLHEVLGVFYRPETGLIVEAVGADGSLVDSFEGRKMNPGHAIESAWFLMDLGVRLGRRDIIDKAVEITINELEYGWDKEYGGVFYFMDRCGKPRHELEWDQKLWWVHVEALISTIKGYRLTGDVRCLEWFERLHEYTWAHFRDPEHPEWFGYLDRKGEVLLPLKGGKWKGCFHVPRGLLNCWKILEELSAGGEGVQW